MDQARDLVHRCLAPSRSRVAQSISAFCIGVLLAPTSWGALFFIAGLAFYELAVWISSPTVGGCRAYDFEVRAMVVLSSVIGWLVGRWVVGRLLP